MNVAPQRSTSMLHIAAALILFATTAGAFPPDAAEPGRWKWDGASCYWDANDSGPDQCDPTPGRWKLNGTSCYWDANDEGPDQCDPNATGRWKWDGAQCYWDGFDSGPAQCDPNNPPQAPSVTLTAPVAGASAVAPAAISLSANASTSQGGSRRWSSGSGRLRSRWSPRRRTPSLGLPPAWARIRLARAR